MSFYQEFLKSKGKNTPEKKVSEKPSPESEKETPKEKISKPTKEEQERERFLKRVYNKEGVPSQKESVKKEEEKPLPPVPPLPKKGQSFLVRALVILIIVVALGILGIFLWNWATDIVIELDEENDVDIPEELPEPPVSEVADLFSYDTPLPEFVEGPERDLLQTSLEYLKEDRRGDFMRTLFRTADGREISLESFIAVAEMDLPVVPEMVVSESHNFFIYFQDIGEGRLGFGTKIENPVEFSEIMREWELDATENLGKFRLFLGENEPEVPEFATFLHNDLSIRCLVYTEEIFELCYVIDPEMEIFIFTSSLKSAEEAINRIIN